MEAARDHKVDDQPEVAVNADGDAFADAAEGDDGFSFSDGEGWVDGAQDKDRGETNMLEGLAEDAGFEGREVCRNVREFGHLLTGCDLAGVLRNEDCAGVL